MKEEIILSETTADSYDDYYKVRCSPADIYWNGHTSPPDHDSFRKLFLSRISAARFTEPEDRRLYLIRLRSGSDLQTVGFVQLIKHSDCVEIGYTVVEEYQRRGIATKAVEIAIRLAKAHSDNICVKIRDDNIASQGVAKKNGFAPTGMCETRKTSWGGTMLLRTYVLNR